MFESRCGLCCSECEGRDQAGCSGCVGMAMPFWGAPCPVKSCCENRGHNHCGECDDFPCGTLSAMGVEEGYDPTPKIANCRRWAEEKRENGDRQS